VARILRGLKRSAARRRSESEIDTAKRQSDSVVTSFLRRLASSPTSERKLPPSHPEEHTAAVTRRRAEFAQSLISSPVYQESIQMLNEMTVRQLVGEADAAKRERLLIRLDVISEYQYLLPAMINQHESLRLIEEQERERAEEEERNRLYGRGTE
jgi:hypothetical protein